MNNSDIKQGLIQFFEKIDLVILAILFGSQTNNQATENSDWDIAVLMKKTGNQLEDLAIKETIKHQLKLAFGWQDNNLDLVDLSKSNLSLASSIADEGIVLKGDNTIELNRFYIRTWSLEEDFYWRLEHENRALSSRYLENLSF